MTMTIEKIIIALLIVAVAVLSILLYNKSTCTKDGYKKCILKDNSSICIPDALYDTQLASAKVCTN